MVHGEYLRTHERLERLYNFLKQEVCCIPIKNKIRLKIERASFFIICAYNFIQMEYLLPKRKYEEHGSQNLILILNMCITLLHPLR